MDRNSRQQKEHELRSLRLPHFFGSMSCDPFVWPGTLQAAGHGRTRCHGVENSHKPASAVAPDGVVLFDPWQSMQCTDKRAGAASS